MREEHGFEIFRLGTLSEKKLVRICHDRHPIVILYVFLKFEWISLENLVIIVKRFRLIY